ncbi:RecX family transcriptional regulator [Acidisoma sp. C75]
MTQAKTARLDEAALREAALAYVARYGGTEASLARVLARRINAWSRARMDEGGDAGEIASAAAKARAAAARVVSDLVRLGAVNDAAFAEARARRLRRSGRSRRAVLAHLAARGIAGERAGAAVPEDARAELAAALAFARRRRAGPFAAAGAEGGSQDNDREEAAAAEARRRILMAFARAGFSAETTRRALAYERAEAEALLRDGA